MSIASEITRLQTDSANIASAISAKGVVVPSGSGYDDYASLIASIPSGGGGTAKIEEIRDSGSGGTTIEFEGLKGEPIAFMVQVYGANGTYVSGSNPKIVTSVLYDGVDLYSASIYKSGSTAREYYYDTCTFTYSSGTLTIDTGSSSNAGIFRNGTYRLVYIYIQ